MSVYKLNRAVVLVAMLAAMHLAAMTTVAQAHTGNDSASARHAALGRVGFLATTTDATLRGLLAQERDYSTWDYGDTSAPAPDEPAGSPAGSSLRSACSPRSWRWSLGSP
jgi:hypothetical protein